MYTNNNLYTYDNVFFKWHFPKNHFLTLTVHVNSCPRTRPSSLKNQTVFGASAPIQGAFVPAYDVSNLQFFKLKRKHIYSICGVWNPGPKLYFFLGGGNILSSSPPLDYTCFVFGTNDRALSPRRATTRSAPRAIHNHHTSCLSWFPAFMWNG